MEQVGEEEDVGDDVDQVQHHQDGGLVDFLGVLCVVKEKDWSGDNSQEKYFISQCLERNCVLHLRIRNAASVGFLSGEVNFQFQPRDCHEYGYTSCKYGSI